MQQLFRPLDHVSDSGGPAGRAQSADVANDSKPGKRMSMALISLAGSQGFSLHAGVAMNTRERKELERICLGGPVGIFPAPHCQKRGWS